MQIMQLCLGFLLEQVDTYYWFKLCSRVLEAHGLAAIDMEQYLGYYNDYHVRMFQYNASCRLSEILENGQLQVTTDQTDQMSKLEKKKKKIMSSGTLQGQNLIFIACFNFSLTWAVSLSPRVHCHLLYLFVCLLPHSYAQLYCSPQIEFKFSIGLKLMAMIIDKYTHCVQKKGNHRQTKWNYHALNYYNQ